MSVSHTGRAWCHKCGITPMVQGARMLGGDVLNLRCNNCDFPLRTTPGSAVWVYDEHEIYESDRRCVLCGKTAVLCFCKKRVTTHVPIGAILPIEEREDVNLKAVFRRMKVQNIEVCEVCNRPCGPHTPYRKCAVCGNQDQYKFGQVRMPAGLVYHWCEQRVERDCEVAV